jgi:hypothetical protein
MFATLVSISRTMVNQPSTNTVGRTVKASEANALRPGLSGTVRG